MSNATDTLYCVTRTVNSQAVVVAMGLVSKRCARAWITKNYPRALPNVYTIRSH